MSKPWGAVEGSGGGGGGGRLEEEMGSWEPKMQSDTLEFGKPFSCVALKGPKHDQIECGFFYINPTSMGW